MGAARFVLLLLLLVPVGCAGVVEEGVEQCQDAVLAAEERLRAELDALVSGIVDDIEAWAEERIVEARDEAVDWALAEAGCVPSEDAPFGWDCSAASICGVP